MWLCCFFPAGRVQRVHRLVLEPGRPRTSTPKCPVSYRDMYVNRVNAVKAGQVLAVLQNPEIAADAAILRQQLALASSDLRNGQDRSDYDQAAGAVRDRKRLQEEFAVAENRVAALQIRAPIDGVVSTVGVSKRPARFLPLATNCQHGGPQHHESPHPGPRLGP